MSRYCTEDRYLRAPLKWRNGKPVENVMHCCGCGSRISVAESRVAEVLEPNGRTHFIFACSSRCEQAYEERP